MKLITANLLLLLLISCNENQLRFKPPQNIHGEVQNLFEIIESHNSIEFYTLEPSTKLDSGNSFHGFPVLDKKQLTEEKHVATIVNNLYESINKNEGLIAECFFPRHGLKIKNKNEEIDLVICFQCSHMRVYAKEETTVLIEGGNKVFDQVARQLNMTLTEN